MSGRDGTICLGCGHRHVSHGYSPERGLGMGACGIDRDERNAASGRVGDPCPCEAFVMPAKIRAADLLPGDVLVDSGWRVYCIAQRLASAERLRVMIIDFEEGRPEHWAPSMLPASDLLAVERDGRPLCQARFWQSDTERCTKPAGHELEVHGNGRYIWGAALVAPEPEPEPEFTGGLLDLLRDAS